MFFIKPVIYKYRILLLMFLITGLSYSGITQAVIANDLLSLKTVKVIGTGYIYNDDIQAVRKGAVSKSLKAAIELVIIELLPVDSLIRDFPILNEIVLKETDQFIQSYKVLTEFRYKKEYRVLVQVIVVIEKIVEQLASIGITYGVGELPKVLLLITEQLSQDSSPEYWWAEDSSDYIGPAEDSIAKIMRNKRFSIVYHKSLKQDENESRYSSSEVSAKPFMSDKPHLNDTEAIELGLRLNADIVIKGTSVAQLGSNVMEDSVKSFKGIVNVRALRTDNGQQIAAGIYNATSAHSDPATGRHNAIANAGILAGKEFETEIATKWQKQTNQPTLVEIVVKGTNNLAYFVQFRRVLNLIQGVKAMHIKEIKADESTIAVDYEANAQKLADMLMFNDFETFGINISEVSNDTLKLALVPIEESSSSLRFQEQTLHDKGGSLRFHKIK